MQEKNYCDCCTSKISIASKDLNGEMLCDRCYQVKKAILDINKDPQDREDGLIRQGWSLEQIQDFQSS